MTTRRACARSCCEYAARWRLEAGFADWIARDNLFCNTLVDRIVSGFPAARAAELFDRLGYEDRLLTMGEIYHSWIIEAPPSLLCEFPVDKTRTPLNVKVVDDAAPYRTIKVRLLNGAHTAMVPLGILLGIESVRGVMEHAELAPFIQQLIYQEVIPSVTEVAPAELETFARDAFDRFRNPHIHHRLLTIALNSSTKVKERILPSLLGYREQTGELPPRLVIALAAFIRLYRGQWRGEAIALNDDPDVLAWFREQWEDAPSTEALARAALGNQALWERDLTQIPGLVKRVSDALDAIEQGRFSQLLRSAGT